MSQGIYANLTESADELLLKSRCYITQVVYKASHLFSFSVFQQLMQSSIQWSTHIITQPLHIFHQVMQLGSYQQWIVQKIKGSE